MTRSIVYKKIQDSDLPFLKALYRSTRELELKQVPHWSEQDKDQFIEMQFLAQHTYYQKEFADANYELIIMDHTRIGRLYLDERDEEFRIIDIALLPEHRNKGIGKKILSDILDKAKSRRKVVRIHVEKKNPAMRLYRKLGFKDIEDKGVYWLMEWNANESKE